MKISEILKNKATISFEVFPPKNNQGDISSIYHTISELAQLNPDFISVTYGAGGSTKGKTVEIASKIKNDYHIESVAHLTCISSTKEEVIKICQQLKENNVENILALRGDYPKDQQFDKEHLEFHYAKELDQFIKQEFPNDFCLSGACYPETHQEADCFENDLKALKEKVDAGAEYLITQIFFDNQYYYRLVKEARKRGIDVPILAGIMPITNSKSLLHTAKMCGCSIPYQLSTMIESYYHYPEAMKEIGINYATHQIIDLITNGVEGIHIYTMNKPEIAQAIFKNIPTVLKELNHE
ncbi:MAG: methylenetetrahydrofolate reductase [NAD(P)H] [Coprobacillus sp.]|nr:methylenetetrahydrofolate reductase [NAD(P)H] [Coprobacillus sp.]